MSEESDVRVLEVDRCSQRCLSEIMYAVLNTGSQILDVYVMDRRAMLINGAWTSADIMVRIPRKKLVESNVHADNIEFFSKIRGVKVKEQAKQHLNTVLSGDDLDKWMEDFSIMRQPGETNEQLRARFIDQLKKVNRPGQ